MIAALDRTLQNLLQEFLPGSLADQVTISFAPPDEQFPPQSVSLPAIDLFLYDVRENREIRNTSRRVQRGDNGMATIYHAPVRVDCSYLITAWASDSVPNPMEDEHNLLGQVMQILLNNSVIPDDVIDEQLRSPTPGLSTVVIQPGHLQSIGEFWQAMGGKPKAALNYTVTISLPKPPETVPLTTRSGIEGQPGNPADNLPDTNDTPGDAS